MLKHLKICALGAALLLVLPVNAQSVVGFDSIEALQQLLKANTSGQSSFTQTVTSAAKADGSKPSPKLSEGTFAYARPGRFRFDYTAPFAQTLVADGTTMWMYDPDLAQVTASNQAATLGNTPAALLTSTADLSGLRTHYTLEGLPSSEGLQWVRATPRQADGALKWVKLGFDDNHVVALVMVDQFGQTSDMRFSAFKPLPANREEVFGFQPPPGVDLIRQ
ncbi:outer membrane lipoprotein chaperone LolA [Comamonadaceae bacterium M7527]|nr:outer membrane lipoprotein chaperone LolA [Comamonadaceae bacterium M7527]